MREELRYFIENSAVDASYQLKPIGWPAFTIKTHTASCYDIR